MLSAYGPLVRAANVTLKRFYIVVSARTGVAGDLASSDRHAVSGVRVECPTPNTITLENWDGFPQPFTPPPASPPWRPFMPPPPQPRREYAGVAARACPLLWTRASSAECLYKQLKRGEGRGAPWVVGNGSDGQPDASPTAPEAPSSPTASRRRRHAPECA